MFQKHLCPKVSLYFLSFRTEISEANKTNLEYHYVSGRIREQLNAQPYKVSAVKVKVLLRNGILKSRMGKWQDLSEAQYIEPINSATSSFPVSVFPSLSEDVYPALPEDSVIISHHILLKSLLISRPMNNRCNS
jgi:hypothetical protein